MKPLKITFHMMTPISLGHPWMHFDGLLMHLKAREALGEDYYVLPSKDPKELGVEIPVAKLERNGFQVYRASVSFFDVDVLAVTTIYKRFYEKDAGTLIARKIDLARGLYRSYMMRLPYIPARRVYFYAYGDPGEIDRLLSALEGLGKKVSIGFGRFREYVIEEVDEDASVVYNGVAMRPIPAAMLRYADRAMMLAYKPPYWDKRNVALCAPPGARVEF